MSADAPHGPGDAAQPPSPEPDAAALLSDLGHSLRTPLNSILGYAQILALDRSEPLSPVQRERVERIQQAGWQLVKLIDEVMGRARGAGTPPAAADARRACDESAGTAGTRRSPGGAG